jgi:phosphoglucosamine mutase
MTPRLFGTDGIRAVAGEFPLDPQSIRALGGALVRLLRDRGLAARVLIGRDTRESGPWMEQALARGINEAGGTPVSAGVIPTSAVSFLTRGRGFAAGVVLSASHNPFRDNGIKVFSSEGFKIPEDWEREIEAAVPGDGGGGGPDIPAVPSDPGLAADYAAYLEGRVRIPAGRKPLRIVLDCANGSGSALAPRIFGALGFDVVPLHDGPDGRNINEGCGSLHPESLARKVMETGADLGAAFDGDADRALWVDETGRILNGDHTLYVQALAMKRAGRLRSRFVVATTMSNMGLEIALAEEGLGLLRTRVGDRYVLDEMRAGGANLGGERSGHTIFLDDMSTGDGILTALKMAESMAVRGRPLSALVKDYVEFPQVLVSVPVAGKTDFGEFPGIVEAVERVRSRLGGDGRLDLRFSGTEPLARVMVEGRDQALVEECAGWVADAVRRHLGPE